MRRRPLDDNGIGSGSGATRCGTACHGHSGAQYSCRSCGRNQGSGDPGNMMRVILKSVGLLMILTGTVWFLQGINILPGSFMTGQIRWAVYGGVTALVGSVLFVAANR